MIIEDVYRYMISGYFGVMEMDTYNLKEYVLKDIENYIRDFVKQNPSSNFDFVSEVEKIKDTVPGVSISTDIIVGFPGETEEDFLETLSLVKECKYDNAFTFIFSKREGTPACKLLDPVSTEEKEKRLQRLNDVVNQYFLENNKKLVDSSVPVLVEGVSAKKNMYYGYTDTNKLVNFTSDKELQAGDIIDVKITEAKTWSLDGEVVG